MVQGYGGEGASEPCSAVCYREWRRQDRGRGRERFQRLVVQRSRRNASPGLCCTTILLSTLQPEYVSAEVDVDVEGKGCQDTICAGGSLRVQFKH